MPILVIFAVAGLIYLLQDRIYKRFWNVNERILISEKRCRMEKFFRCRGYT